MRRLKLVVGLGILYAALLAGVVVLMRVSFDERDDALEQLARERGAVHALARHALLDELSAALDDVEAEVDRALADPLVDARGLLLEIDGEQVLPRAVRFASTSRVGDLLARARACLNGSGDDPADGDAQVHCDLGEGLSEEAGTRLGLAMRLRRSGIEVWLDHRSRHVLPADIDLVSTLLGLERLAAEQHRGLEPGLADQLLRRGVERADGRVPGFFAALLSGRPKVTKGDFELLAQRALELAKRSLVRVDDFESRAAEVGVGIRLPALTDGRRVVELARGSGANVCSGDRPAPAEGAGRLARAIRSVSMRLHPHVVPKRMETSGERLCWGVERLGARVVGRVLGLDEGSPPVETSPCAWLDHLAGRLAAADQIDVEAEVSLGADGLSVVIDSPRWEEQARQAESRLWLKLVPLGIIALLGGLVLVLALTLLRRRSAYIALRSNLLAAVSHELKTPLASIRALAETLERRLDNDPRARDYPQRIVRSTERLAFLVDNVLSFARLDRGIWKLRPSALSVAEVLVRLRQLVDGTVSGMSGGTGGGAESAAAVRIGGEGARGSGAFASMSRPVVLMTDVNPPDLSLEADPELVLLLLSNLVDNARRYATADRVTVRVVARVTGDCIEMRVSDDGPGLPTTTPGRFFSELAKGHLEGVRGTGLGLTICRQVMELHGGTIALESSGVGGTTFLLRFPAAGAHATAPMASSRHQEAP